MIQIISEFVGLTSKMYSLVDVDGKEKKTAKGVNRVVVQNTRHKDFVDVSFGREVGDTEWKEFKVNYIKLELMMLVKFLCLVLMIKDNIRWWY